MSAVDGVAGFKWPTGRFDTIGGVLTVGVAGFDGFKWPTGKSDTCVVGVFTVGVAGFDDFKWPTGKSDTSGGVFTVGVAGFDDPLVLECTPVVPLDAGCVLPAAVFGIPCPLMTALICCVVPVCVLLLVKLRLSVSPSMILP